jgi:hypothetical protein
MAEDQSQQRNIEPAGAIASAAAAPEVNWDDSAMRTSYANVVNAASTREEVTLFFGTNLTWKPDEARKFHFRLNDRIVLNPYAAKRLWMLMGALLREYETHFGPLKIEVPGKEAAASHGDSKSVAP